MTYIFPKRVLRDKDVLDPVDMNADYVPVSELCSGHLNAHNFRDDVDFAPATNALFSHSYSATAADHGMGNAGPPSMLHQTRLQRPTTFVSQTRRSGLRLNRLRLRQAVPASGLRALRNTFGCSGEIQTQAPLGTRTIEKSLLMGQESTGVMGSTQGTVAQRLSSWRCV